MHEHVREFYETVLSGQQLHRLGEFIDDAYEGPQGERGPSGYADSVKPLFAAFPDLKFTVEDLISTADSVVVRWTWRATHRKAFAGIEATGKSVINTGIVIARMREGKMIRAWSQIDRFGLLQQLRA